jgi:hypothetical protein
MKETRILCDICGKVTDSQSPAQFDHWTYLGVSQSQTMIRATVKISDGDVVLDACEACYRATVKLGRWEV